MYVKLVNPRTKATQVFKVHTGEVHYDAKGRVTERDLDRWAEGIRESGWEARTFSIWPAHTDRDTEIEVVEIVIAGPKASQTQMVRTNWDAYLINDQGRTLDRIWRHFEALPQQLELDPHSL